MTDPTTFVPVRRMISDPGYVPASPWIATDASRNYNRRTPFWFQPRGTLAPVQIGVHGLGGLAACCSGCATGKPCMGCLNGIYRVATLGQTAGTGSIDSIIAQAQRTTQGYAIPVAIGATIGYLSEKKSGLVVGALAGAALKWAYSRWVSPIVTPVVETVQALTPPGVSGFREDIAWDPSMTPQDTALDRSAFRFLQAIFIVGAATLALKAAKSAGVIGRKRNGGRRGRSRNPVGARYRIKGYAYELQGKNWRRAKDDSWDQEVVGVEGPMVGRRFIDGSAVIVIKADQSDIPSDVGKFYAITVTAANASRV